MDKNKVVRKMKHLKNQNHILRQKEAIRSWRSIQLTFRIPKLRKDGHFSRYTKDIYDSNHHLVHGKYEIKTRPVRNFFDFTNNFDIIFDDYAFDKKRQGRLNRRSVK